jgi:membrane associated rhomboid family serine protease
MGFLAVPVVVGAVGAVLAQRSYGVTAYDSAALRGFGSGFVAALLTTLAITLAGGPMGTGRMADIGAPVGEVLVSAVAAMSLGGLVAGVATAWWQRRRAARTAPADD